MKKVVLILTPAQARMVNSGLALLEAEAGSDDSFRDDYRPDVMARTRATVHEALDTAGVKP